MRKKLSKFKPKKPITLLLLAILMVLTIKIVPAQAQILWLPDLREVTSWFPQSTENQNVSVCIRLDGRCLFKIVTPKSDAVTRVRIIEERLNEISWNYLQNPSNTLKISQRTENNLPNIYINTKNEQIRLLTVTNLDSQLDGIDPNTKADQIIEQLRLALQQSKRERQPSFLLRQTAIALVMILIMSISHWLIVRRLKSLKQSKKLISPTENVENQPISAIITRRQQWNLKEVQYRLLQLLQISIWSGGILWILGLFPHTRILQVFIIGVLRIPVRIVLVGIATYVLIRLSYALIAKLNALLVGPHFLDFDNDQRLQLRLKTVSVVTRSIIALLWVGIGFIVALSVIGVNIAPVLAGLGILGVAVSLASQNLIRDGINGFLIILEDQYAVGDVIQVDSFTGLVENINLRITQLRDSEGRLITIPNSEIKIVANFSSHWSRADLQIPIPYQADVDRALRLVKEVGETLSQDLEWQEILLESPQVLGIEHFGDRGVMIRIWIKTQPLKQWDTAREFRRRLKIAFDQAGIPLPLPQQQIWFKKSTLN